MAKISDKKLKEMEAKVIGRSTGMAKTIPITTLDSIPGHRITEVLGVFVGTSAKSRAMGPSMLAGFKAGTVGGNIDRFSELIEKSTSQAIRRMCAKAVRKGAQAVLGVKITSSEVMGTVSEVTAYGTGVILEHSEK